MKEENTDSLIDQMNRLETAKAERIKALLKERVDIEEVHNSRQDAIAGELKALGYKRPRAAKAAA